MGDIPALPRWLGLAGLLPQALCVAVLFAGPGELREPGQWVALSYAALILAFLGGSWWGVAAAAPAAERRRMLGWLWIAAVLPSLVSLACLLAPLLARTTPEPSLVMLGAAIMISPAVDARLGPLAPRWWMALRVPLSIGLGAATLAAGFA